MPKSLVIVESPGKIKNIKEYLGDDYDVQASYGHVRDLEPRGLSVDVDDHFRVDYVVPPQNKATVTKLKAALKGADELILASDEDREGEAIAWHVREVLKPTVPVKRMVFHEITREAIQEAIEHPRDLDMKLVESQEGRRVLDRLVGYEVSPVLWRRVGGARSAGRVQSVATRLVVERERERMAFNAAGYWDLDGSFGALGIPFGARLAELDGRRIATGRDFDAATGALTEGSDARHLAEADAVGLASRLVEASFRVASAESKPFTERPKAPFKTTTLQQEAGNKLRFSAARTMSIAQGLYERGHITYMRTDSVQLSQQAVDAARSQIVERFGADYLPPQVRTYANKVKNAQEAHEAIRPAGAEFRTPDSVAGDMNRDERALYEMIWMRTVASQMTDARGRTLTLRVGATSSANEQAIFRTSGRTYEFLGFRKAYVDVSETPASDDAEANLPGVTEGDAVACTGIEPSGHTTQPPARYTEASLVAELERRAIGRPSTYASIIDKITNERGYVWKKGSALVPSWTAFAKIQLMERYFGHLVDYGFTATMEEALDEVAAGRAEAEKWLHAFYFGNGHEGLKELVSDDRLAKIDKSEVNAVRIGADAAGNEIIVRVWNNGETLHRLEEKAPLPVDMEPDELTVERAEELLAKGAAGPRELGVDPETGEKVLALNGRFGPFVQLGEIAEGSKKKPPRASLFKTMDPDTVTLEEALQLLALPRVVGADAEGAEITAQNGRYGPYLKKGTDSRSLEAEDQLFTITLEAAEAIFAQPKTRRGQQAKAPLAELGEHPDSGAPVRVLDGRFGPYVTDGTTNATVRRGMDPTALTLEDGVELLRERAARGPAKKTAKRAKKAGKKTAKKTTGKRTTGKKTAVKQTTKRVVKKSAAKKAAKRATPRAAAPSTVDDAPALDDDDAS